MAVVLTGASRQGVLLSHHASGLSFGYTVAPLSAWFLVVLAMLAIPAAFYSVGYLSHAVSAGRTAFVAAGFNVLLGTVEAVFVADGVVAFLFAWELMTLTTAALTQSSGSLGAAIFAVTGDSTWTAGDWNTSAASIATIALSSTGNFGFTRLPVTPSTWFGLPHSIAITAAP